MVRGRLNVARLSLRLITFALPAAAFAVAAYFRFKFLAATMAGPIDSYAYLGLLIVAMTTWALVVEHYHVCDLEQIFAASGKTRRTIVAVLVTYCAVLAAAFFYRHASFSRLFIFTSAIILFCLATAMRIFFRVFLTWRNHDDAHSAKILVVGTDEFAHRIARSLRGGQVVPCTIVGFVRLPDQRVLVNGCPIYEMQDLPKLAIGNGIDDVVLAISPTRFADVPDILSKLTQLSAPVRMALDLGENILIQEKLFNFGGMVMLDLVPTPVESSSYLVQKAVFDIFFSILILLLASPFMALIAIAIKLNSPGPIFFTQERVGLNGQPFRMYKFRTMKFTSSEESDTRWTTPDDERRTKLGTFLRRCSLDELPQFFNVLMGNMSIVGPRPERLHFVRQFLQDIDGYNRRHAMKVGITGWAQVNGWRGDTCISKRIEYDLYYLRNWSISFDLQIMLLTISRSFFQKNAY